MKKEEGEAGRKRAVAEGDVGEGAGKRVRVGRDTLERSRPLLGDLLKGLE